MARAPLEVVGLSASYDGRRVLHDVTLAVARSEITVLLGPSGAGKSTCIKHMVGLELPREGHAFINGRDTTLLTEDELRTEQRGLSVMLQGATLFGGGLAWSLSPFENVAVPLRARMRLTEASISERVRAKLAEFGLEEWADEPLSHLSAGTVQRVSLARALVSDSDIVVLDSPESGVDAVRMNAVIEGIRSAHERTKGTFLIATHHVGLAQALADRLVIIRAGRVVEQGRFDDVMRDENGFASRFAEGGTLPGLTMTDELEGPAEELPQLVEPSNLRVGLHVTIAVIALLAIVAVLLVGLVVFRGPNVPPGQ